MKLLGVTILQGVEFPIFPIHFAWALQQQRYCAACDDKLVNRRYCGYTKLVYSAHRTVVGLAYSLADCNSTTAQLLIF